MWSLIDGRFSPKVIDFPHNTHKKSASRWLPRRDGVVQLSVCGIVIKKAGNRFLIARPACRGLRIAHRSLNEQRRIMPHAEYVVMPSVCSRRRRCEVRHYGYRMSLKHILLNEGIYCAAYPLASVMKVAKFLHANRLAPSKRFFTNTHPHPRWPADGALGVEMLQR